MKLRRIGLLLLVVGLVTAAGCASTKDLKALQSEVDTLKTQVAATDSKADQALRDAQSAKSQSDMTEEKIDRMFKQSMLK